jgi:ubiquinone/menaquinone biosynthesis C-methylase UbiE
VIAVDVSPVMQRALRRNVAVSGYQNVESVSEGFLNYPHDGEAVDFAYSRYALHHLPDFWKAVALMRLAGIMRPNGVLRLWDVV